MSTSTTGRRDWSARPVPAAMSVAELAGFVETSIARMDGLLFTATPAEELDEIGRLQQLKDQAYAAQLRAIVAAHNRAGREERARLGVPHLVRVAVAHPSAPAQRLP